MEKREKRKEKKKEILSRREDPNKLGFLIHQCNIYFKLKEDNYINTLNNKKIIHLINTDDIMNCGHY